MLADPITTKITSMGKGNGMRYTESSMQGWRNGMEDAHINVIGLPGNPDLSVFAVLDGHGGSFIAQQASKGFVDALLARPELKESKSLDSLENALSQAFIDVDASLRELPEITNHTDESGSTAVITLVTPTHLLCANAGDSRTVLCREGKPVPLSFDHKPTNEVETARIEKAGGSVLRGRVCGGIGVSRGFGDFCYKAEPSLQPAEQQVTVVPDITKEERQPAVDEFLLCCCDGVWDVMTNERACAFVRDELVGGNRNTQKICEALLDECFKLGSRDNMSIILVLFPAGRALLPPQPCCVVA